MIRIVCSRILIAMMFAGLTRAADMQTTGAKADKVKKEILDLLNEEIAAFKSGPLAGDFIDRHEVDSIKYFGGANQGVTKAQRADEWRTNKRKVITQSHHDFHVRVYDNGNVAVVDFIGEIAPRINGKEVQPYGTHVSRVYLNDNGVWRAVVQDVFVNPIGAGSKTK